jgi:hypothetical protein
MKVFDDFRDERHKAFCPYCGRTTEPRNREHVPSKVLLDEPYPENLPIIHPCVKCNTDLSKHEEYVACLIECARIGSCDVSAIERAKVRAALRHSPKMAARIRDVLGRSVLWSTQGEDFARVETIVRKLAMGHVAFELGEPILAEPTNLSFFPKMFLSPERLISFESPPSFSLLAEVGSQALYRQVESASGKAEWIVVQPGRYRYLTYFSGAVMVRSVISEFLACEVGWDLSRVEP